MAKEEPKWIIDILLNLSKKLRERTTLPKDHLDYLNPSSVNNYFKPIRKLLDMNDIMIPWKRIYTTFPEIDNITQSREWRRDEIQTMMKYGNGATDSTIVLIAASSGIRAGAFNLNWEDVIPIYKVGGKLKMEVSKSEITNGVIVCAMIIAYKGTSAQYPAFITSEAYDALQNHKKEWKNRIGRDPNPEEPIFINEGILVRRASTMSIKRRVERMIERAGLRAPLTEGKKRHDVPIMNGFRRFFNKTITQELSSDSALASLIKKEFMMGHTGLVKLDRNYFKTNVIELAKEYLEASSSLIINDEHILKVENKNLRQQKKDLENTSIIQNLQKQIDELRPGQDAREGEYAKNTLHAKTPLEKVLHTIFPPVFEWGNDEKYKRKFWKEYKDAVKEKRIMNPSVYDPDYVEMNDDDKREMREYATRGLEELERQPRKESIETLQISGKLGSRKIKYHHERALRDMLLKCGPVKV